MASFAHREKKSSTPVVFNEGFLCRNNINLPQSYQVIDLLIWVSAVLYAYDVVQSLYFGSRLPAICYLWYAGEKELPPHIGFRNKPHSCIWLPFTMVKIRHYAWGIICNMTGNQKVQMNLQKKQMCLSKRTSFLLE